MVNFYLGTSLSQIDGLQILGRLLHGIEAVLSPALHCLQRLSGCVLLPSTIWIASFFVFMLRLSFCWWGVVEKQENTSKHIYVIIGCSVSLESLFCASAWH